MTSVTHVRPAAPGDLQALHAMEVALFRGHGYPYFFLRQALDAMPAFFLVAEADGRVAGHALGSMQAGDGHGWVLGVGVGAGFQRRGIGRALTVELLGAFAKKGATEAFLHVAPRNEDAIRIYRRLGFEEVRGEPDYFGPGEDRLILRCALPVE